MSNPAGIAALEKAVHAAIALHQSGEIAAARAAYETILKNHPRDPNVLMNLSTLERSQDNLEVAGKLLKRLVDAYPKIPQAHFAQGNVLMDMGKPDAALGSFDRAIALAPTVPEFHHNRGVVLDSVKRFTEALAAYDQALAIDVNHALAYRNRVTTLNYLGRYEEALAATNHPFAMADPAWRLFTRGVALQELGRMDEALGQYGQAIALNPARSEPYSYRANAYNYLHRYEEALADIERAMELGESSAFAHNVRAVALNGHARYAEAAEHYAQAIAKNAELESAYWNLGLVKLTMGDYAGGLPLYEWRWKAGPLKDKKRDMAAPLWLGETPIAGKTLLVHPEQGLGDFIQCARYLPLLAKRGAHVVLATPPTLIGLMRGSFDASWLTVVDITDTLPATDFHCPVMSLPLALGLTLETIPAPVSYLKTNAKKVTEWEARLGPKTRPRIGLVWSGAAGHIYDYKRSIPLEMLQPLLQQNFEFYSLQKELREADVPHLGPIATHADLLQDFSDTAALTSLMDRVISVDTSVAHLTGALGVPVWILLYSVPDYRWLTEREDSPLYPTARLFRQEGKHDWAKVVARVAGALGESS